MPLDASKRRRVEIPADLYEDIATHATALHMPVQTLIVSMLARALQADRARAALSFEEIGGKPAATAKARAAADRKRRQHEAFSDALEAELNATREVRRVKS